MLLQIPSVLKPDEITTLRGMLSSAAFEDGGATAGFAAREVKRNLQVPMASETGRKGAAVVLEALRRNTVFFSAALPHRIHGPIFNRYDTGMTYGEHVDNALMGSPVSVRSDVAATLFLTPPEDYDGGELTVHDSYGAHRIKLAAGNMIVYPATSRHRVEPITRGSRVSVVMWIQSLVRDEMNRRLLFEMDVAIGSLRKQKGTEKEVATLTAIYHNLVRLWSET
ncbi:MAG TPA: Fe2+-dependent dioxygenase [Burkholderiales bacterium]